MGARASVAALAIAASAPLACGPSRPPFAPEHAARAWTGATSLGPPVVAAARAMFDALQGRPYDEGWHCADPATDIRATAGADKGKIVALGTGADLVLAAVRMTLDSPAKSGFDPSSVADYPGSGPARAFVQGYAMVSPDAHVSWADASAYLSALEEPNKDHAAVASLVAPLGADLTRLVAGLSSNECAIPLMTEGDLDRLAYPLDRDEREIIVSKLSLVAHALPRACKVAAAAAGPWEVHFSHVEAIYRSSDTLAKVRSKLSIYNDAFCLGPVEVVAVAATQ